MPTFHATNITAAVVVGACLTRSRPCEGSADILAGAIEVRYRGRYLRFTIFLSLLTNIWHQKKRRTHMMSCLGF